jgi:hypothetical protein
LIDDRSKRCQRCYNIHKKGLPGNRKGVILTQEHKDKISISTRGKKANNYKDGRCSKLYRCERCNSPIHMYTFLYGKKLCKSCVKIGKNNPMRFRKNNIVKHHIYKRENGGPVIEVTDKIHSKLHSRAYDFIYEEYGKQGIHKYLKWFSKKFGIKII